MPSWSFRVRVSKSGERTYYARARVPVRQPDGSISQRQVERNTGARTLAAARKIAEELDRELIAAARAAVPGETLTFMHAAETYLLSGGSGRYLDPILERIGLEPLAKIDQARVARLAAELYPGCAASTVNRQLYTPISAVARFVGHDLKLKRPKGHDKLPAISRAALPDDDWFEAVLPLLTPPRRALLLLISIHGLRISEAAERRLRDFDDKRGALSVPDTKTGVPAHIPLAEPVLEAFETMLAHYAEQEAVARSKGRLPAPREWLFGSPDRNKAARAFRNAAKRAGLPTYGTHKLGRHCFAARILEDGRSLPFLKRAGRWKSLKAVERYAHLEQSEVDAEVQAIGKRWITRKRKGG
jgi:integrase